MVVMLARHSLHKLEISIASNYEYSSYAKFTITMNDGDIEDQTEKHHCSDNEGCIPKRNGKQHSFSNASSFMPRCSRVSLRPLLEYQR